MYVFDFINLVCFWFFAMASHVMYDDILPFMFVVMNGCCKRVFDVECGGSVSLSDGWLPWTDVFTWSVDFEIGWYVDGFDICWHNRQFLIWRTCIFLLESGVIYLSRVVLENRLLHSRVDRTCFSPCEWQSPRFSFTFQFPQPSSSFCRGCAQALLGLNVWDGEVRSSVRPSLLALFFCIGWQSLSVRPYCFIFCPHGCMAVVQS